MGKAGEVIEEMICKIEYHNLFDKYRRLAREGNDEDNILFNLIYTFSKVLNNSGFDTNITCLQHMVIYTLLVMALVTDGTLNQEILDLGLPFMEERND